MWRYWMFIGAMMAIMAAQAKADETDPGWQVFADEGSHVYSQPDTTSETLKSLSKGDTVIGEYLTHPEEDSDWLQVVTEGKAGWVPRWHLNRIHPANRSADDNLPIGEEKVDRWWGLPIEYKPTDLERIPQKHCYQERREYYLRKDALDALLRLLNDAEKEGIIIIVNSAFRPGDYQKKLYERAVDRAGPSQRYSAPPGHSEHQLGTCLDLTDPAGKFAFKEAFGDCPQGKWLEKNAGRYGFKRSYYPNNTEETGYISEPWHWRYWGEPKPEEPPASLGE